MATKKMHLLLLMLLSCTVMSIAQQNIVKLQRAPNTSWYFTPMFKTGDTLSNVYSRTIAFTGVDFKDLVQRISGTSTYTVIDSNPLQPVFAETDHYDGRPASSGTAIITFSGKGGFNGKTFVNTSASGLLFSELVWGKLPSTIKQGDSWQTQLVQAWELGGAGIQRITVVQTDIPNHTVVLKREGSSEGLFDNDPRELSITTKADQKLFMKLLPGPAHWTGYTTFKNGVVFSDELMVNRTIRLQSDSLVFDGHQRQYILLNLMPPGSM